MTTPRPRMLYGYGPLVAAAVLFTLMAAFVPTVGPSIVGTPARDSVVPLAPSPDSGAYVGNADTSNRPAGNSGSATVAPRHSAVPPGATGPCLDRPRQVPGDPYSPPCVAFSGDNGGATARGVTSDTIIVSSRVLGDFSTVGSVLSQLTGGDITVTSEDVQRTAQGLVDYFNTRFQLYGRKLKLVFYDGRGSAVAELLGGGVEEAQADAIRAAKEVKAFADLGSFTAPYVDALARQQVLSFGAPAMPREWMQARRPYTWSTFTECTTISEHLGDYANKRLYRRPARWAGGALRNKPRVLGAVGPDNSFYRSCYEAGDRVVEAAGNRPADLILYKLDFASMSNQAASVVAKLKASGVTTVLCGCDPLFPVFLTAKASEQGFEPEWIVSGVPFLDLDVSGQLYDQTQWSRAFGLSLSGQSQPPRATHAYHAYKAVRRDEPVTEVAELFYSQLYMLALGIQLAGPDLTPQTFERGMFSYAGGSGPQGTWSFAPGRYTPAVDSREIWWDPTRLSAQSQKRRGAYVDSEPGKRYRFGDWPPGDPPTGR